MVGRVLLLVLLAGMASASLESSWLGIPKFPTNLTACETAVIEMLTLR